ncbi:zinc finger protein 830 [Strongylocentrotus purpuratus]|uniref:Zinc finger protein 830 n=1 Tax=Strongylocentrotus purpuratus TaxID=7668 RepID=A0A7M7MZF3_STRPU|nr:zinc finger protein 830 [Strongylocentrotus purpuratus]
MAAPSGRKKVDLRELMRQKKAAKQTSVKRIESPLAKYNNLGQLICVVCNQQVKNEILWTAHLQGKKHKDNVVLLKTGKQAGNKVVSTHPVRSNPLPLSQSTTSAKRKAEPAATAQPVKGILKKPRIGLPYDDSSSDESDNETTQDKLPADFFDNGKGTSSTPRTATSSTSSSQVKSRSNDAIASGLPADFFDSGASSNNVAGEPSGTDGKEDQDQANKPMAEVLPEGFFDDPVKDAKVRKVEVRNTMEEEWEKFQKEMQTQQQVSENLAEEDDEAAQTERNIDEIDEQIQCFAKVETLWDKKDELKSKAEDREKKQDENELDESGDEADFDEFLNWRSKGAYK